MELPHFLTHCPQTSPNHKTILLNPLMRCPVGSPWCTVSLVATCKTPNLLAYKYVSWQFWLVGTDIQILIALMHDTDIFPLSFSYLLTLFMVSSVIDKLLILCCQFYQCLLWLLSFVTCFPALGHKNSILYFLFKLLFFLMPRS